jgi:tRNA A37 threonylcarbamoyladenosine modification protein TsaB
LAYNENGGKVLALIDAKHNGFYVCGYNDKKVDFPPQYLTRDKVEEIAKDYKILASAPIEGFDVTTVSVLDGLIRAVEEKTEQITFDLESLVPLYVRKSQAEEGR